MLSYQSSQMLDVADFDENSLERLVQELNQMFVVNINTIDKTKEILSRYGIKFIIVPKFDKTPIDGFSFWQGKNPTIVLTLRLNKIDNYAFACRSYAMFICIFSTIKNRNILP